MIELALQIILYVIAFAVALAVISMILMIVYFAIKLLIFVADYTIEPLTDWFDDRIMELFPKKPLK